MLRVTKTLELLTEMSKMIFMQHEIKYLDILPTIQMLGLDLQWI